MPLSPAQFRAVKTLAGGIAHNFNNLLAGIQGMVSLMKLRKTDQHPSYDQLIEMEGLIREGAQLPIALLEYVGRGIYAMPAHLAASSAPCFYQVSSQNGRQSPIANLPQDVMQGLADSDETLFLGRLVEGMARKFERLLQALARISGGLREGMSVDHPDFNRTKKIEILSQKGCVITGQLKAYGRATRPAIKPTRINQVVLGTRLPFDPIRKRIRVQYCLGRKLPHIQADAAGLKNALQHLLTNAAEAMPQGGRVTISTELMAGEPTPDPAAQSTGNGCVRLSVRDTGIGMDVQTRRQIFDPFFTTKPVPSKKGMGLAAVYGSVSRMQGRVSVESNLGKGTELSIYIPACETPPYTVPLAFPYATLSDVYGDPRYAVLSS
jgi:signal transduction histidine kinase